MVQKDMNKYMRAIGFQKYSIKDFERMLLELGKHREYYRMGSNWQNERMFEICQPVDGNRENARTNWSASGVRQWHIVHILLPVI